MNLGELLRQAETIVPEADNSVIPSISTSVWSKRDIFNEAASEFVRITKCFPKDKKFDCSAESYTYSLIDNVSDFLEMRPEGVWHNRTSTSTTMWWRLQPTTIRELDQRFTNWRDQNPNDNLRYYWQDGDTLGVFYTPSQTVTDGLWIYYYATSSNMTSITDFPFTGTSVQSTRLKPYEKYLMPYYEYRVLGLLGYKEDAKAKQQEFYQLCTNARNDLQGRRDLTQETGAKPKTLLNMGNPFRGA